MKIGIARAEGASTTHERADMEPIDLLIKLRDGGHIVSTGDLSVAEIAEARADRRMFVDADGFGYVYIPARSDGGSA